MMSEKDQKRLRVSVIGLIALLILFFLAGALDLGGKPLFVLMLLFLAMGAVTTIQTLVSKADGKLNTFLLLTGFSAIIFALALLYGIAGIWGFYEINDVVYLTSAILSFAGFVTGVIGSLILMKKGGKPDAAIF